MSAPDDRLPPTTGRAIAVAAVVGTLALAVHEPTVIVGALAGAALAAASLGFAGSRPRVTAAAALLPVAVTGAVAGLGLAASPTVVVPTVLAMIVGLAAVTLVTAGPSPAAIRRTGSAALYAAIVTGGAALLAVGVVSAGGVRPTLEAVVWLTGDGATGLLLWIVVAGAAVAGGLLALPPAAIASPRRLESAVAVRTGLVQAVAVGTALALVLVWAAVMLVGVEPLAGWAAGSGVIRGVVAAVAFSFALLAALGLLVRDSWHRTGGRSWHPTVGRGNAVVPVVVGSGFGVAVAFVVAAGVSGGAFDAVAALFSGATVALIPLRPTMTWYAGRVDDDGVAVPTTPVAAALAVGGVVTAADADVAGGTGLVWGGLASLVAIGAGLFAYDVGRYGEVLAREIGTDGATRRPQFVRLAWSGTVAVAGVVVATGGLWIATALAPTLSVPSTAGAVAGLAAVVAGAWLLLR